MAVHTNHIRDRFCMAGISYRTADAALRGSFAIDEATNEAVVRAAVSAGLRSVFVVSTCNRTEIYGYANSPKDLASLLCRFTCGGIEQFEANGYAYAGESALHHLFKVAAGLDSQIVGDYEIQAQLKQAIKIARTCEAIGPIMDRTLNFVFQAGKKIRSTTGLSNGTVSVSYAAVEWLRSTLPAASTLQVLVLGTGKFGVSLAKNLKHYLPHLQLTFCNRTKYKADELATLLGASVLNFNDLSNSLHRFDVIVTSTFAPEPLIMPWMIGAEQHLHIVDLGIPANAHTDVQQLPNVNYANVDRISAIVHNTVQKRLQHVEAAEAIIESYELEFYNWLHQYRHTNEIKQVRQQLCGLAREHSLFRYCEAANPVPQQLEPLVQETMNNLMLNLKNEKEKGCYIIGAYERVLKYSSETQQFDSCA